LTLELAKINERIPIYEKENQRLRTALDYYNKQVSDEINKNRLNYQKNSKISILMKLK
jgi:hypothetical protein